MISFTVLNEDSIENINTKYTSQLSDEDTQNFMDIAESYISDDDVEFAISFSSGCALIRVFDMGRYSFMFPYEICADANPHGAISDMSEYAMREEIPFVVCDS